MRERAPVHEQACANAVASELLRSYANARKRVECVLSRA